MVRLNGEIALPTNSSENRERQKGGLKISFFGMVGIVMAALSLKERWDAYKKVPEEPNSNNPLAPPSYRDDSDDDAESAIGLTTAIDTEIPMPRKTKRKKNCCMCCGLNCALFCKALGIVVVIFTVWNLFKFARWMMTPSPTGLEDMPAYSSSLGCEDASASHWFQGSTDGIYYTIPIGRFAEHEINIKGGAVGTLEIAPSDSIDDSEIKVKTTIRTNEQALLDTVTVGLSDSREPQGKSYYRISTPLDAPSTSSCMRYDVTVFIPPTLRRLSVYSTSVAQVKFADSFSNSPRELSDLLVTLRSRASKNLLLPNADLASDHTELRSDGGYIVGSVALANETVVDTFRYDTVSNLKVVTTAYRLPSDGGESEAFPPAHLSTRTGHGRSDFEYINAIGRPIDSVHNTAVMSAGDLYLTYKQASFNGPVSFKAKSHTAIGLQGSGFDTAPGGGMPQMGERWAGDKNGGDSLSITSFGWVGLYF
ncbi:hypothetical protein SCHPADRAFT_843310 [Schizopora paradoxa]|uniref:Uncharacterized protein n=1 Tax=Schizopora paradoxa TaxID=27342 RepID=A0A0H2SCK8_9AGAM|nr:hypothetical protein SCHPADRAFT_843310 [Schizopora paradoxa]